MSQRFQLPCPQCQAIVPIETRHAGSVVVCERCQADIEVPKLRELKRLEPIAASPDKAKSPREWGGLSGGLFVFGVLLLTLAIGASLYIYFWQKRYQPLTEKPTVTAQEASFSLQDATLTDTWKFWGSLLEVTDVSQRTEPVFIWARERVSRLQFWSKIFYGTATVGILSIIASVFTRQKAIS